MITNREVGEKRHIAYICDENYLIPTIVSVQSLLENIEIADGIQYVIHICTFDTDKENWQKFHGMEKKGVKIQIHHLDFQRYQERYDKILQKTYVTTTALLKFELSNILSDIEEVLYLDSDVIVNQSVDQIFEYDITQYALAAVFDLIFYLAGPHDKDPMAVPKAFYFNSGVMLMNLKEFRRRNIPELLWESKFDLVDSPQNTMNLMDQNALNEVLSQDCLPLPIRYNCSNDYVANMNTNIDRINHLYDTDYQDAIDLGEDAVVIHYIGRRSKPWLYESCACRDMWDRYCRHAGMDLSELHRQTEEGQGDKDFNYYVQKGFNLLKTKGIRETCRFVWYKMKLRMSGR